MLLFLRPARMSRPGGPWSEHDYDVFDGERAVGRNYSVAGRPDGEWFWGIAVQLTGRKNYASARSLDEAKAAFRAEYEARTTRGREIEVRNVRITDAGRQALAEGRGQKRTKPGGT
jgi:hypothetical protein